jgi:hypothetical protein
MLTPAGQKNEIAICQNRERLQINFTEKEMNVK